MANVRLTNRQWRMLLEIVLRLLYRLYPKMVMDAWEESEHKRDKDGKFAVTEGGGGGSSAEEKSPEPLKKSEKSGIIEAGKLIVPTKKLTDYALDPTKAPDKAKAFEIALGYTKENAHALIENLAKHIDSKSFVEKGNKGYGKMYECITRLTGANGKQANVLTAWIEEASKMRMTSIYVTKKKVKE